MSHTFHKYKSKAEAKGITGRYMGMHGRELVRFKGRYIAVGVHNGSFHALGDHGWAFALDAVKHAELISKYLLTAIEAA